MLFNLTSTIKSFTADYSGINGVVFPQSDKVLFLSDIEMKIKKTKSHIDHLSQTFKLTENFFLT